MNGNYDLTFVGALLTITPATGAPLDISNYSDVYDGMSHSITVNNLITGDTAYYRLNAEDEWSTTLPTFTDVTDEVTVYVKVTNPNYEDRTGIGTVKITPKAVTVTANSDSFVYDGTEKTVSGYTVTGLLAGHELHDVGATRTEKNVGDYEVPVTGTPRVMDGSEDNLNLITKESGTLTITAAQIPVTIKPNTQIFTYDGTEKTVEGYTVTGLLEGHVLSGVSAGRTEKNVGTYLIDVVGEPKVTDGGVDVTENYTFTKGQGKLLIEEATVVVRGKSGTFTYDGTEKTVEGYEVTGLVEGHVLSGVSASRTEKNVGEYLVEVTGTAIIMDGSEDVTRNYIVKRLSGQLTIEPAQIPMTVKANSGIFTYDGTEKTVSGYDVTGLLDGHRLEGLNASRTEKNVGDYEVEVTGEPKVWDGDVDVTGNYDIDLVSGTLTIEKRNASVTPNDKSKVYGDEDPDLDGVLEGFIATDGVTARYTRVTGEDVGEYDITATLSPAGTRGNNITYNTGKLSIGKVAITVTAITKSKTYGDADPELTYTVTSGELVGDDEFTGALDREDGENVGTYEITQGTLVLERELRSDVRRRQTLHREGKTSRPTTSRSPTEILIRS